MITFLKPRLFILFLAGYKLLEGLSHLLPNYTLNRKCSFRQCLLEIWRNRFTRIHLLIMFLLGLVVAPIFIHVHKLPVLIDVEDVVGIDWLMRLNQGKISPTRDKDIPPFVLLDVGDKTYKAWGEPLFTPHNHVHTLIEKAVEAEAKLIVIDIDLTRPTPIDGLSLDFDIHPFDANLIRYFSNYPAYCKQKKNLCPTIILMRTFESLENSHDATKIQQKLSFAPQETFETGLRKTLQWYLDNSAWYQRVLDGSYRGERLGLL